MDTSVSDANHLDTDVLLPPRKRLLAGLKRQSCSQSTSQCSQENNQSPSLSPSPSSQPVPLTEFDIRLNNLLRSYKNGSNMSPEEIAKAAKSAAVVAAKSAEAARAAAEEKAAVAAKAVSAAKRALDLVASMVEDTGGRDKHQRKNKSKKQVPTQVLCKNYQPADSKGHRHKKLKISPTNEKNGICNGNDEGSNEETLSVEMDGKMLKTSKSGEIEVNSCEVKSSHPKEKDSKAFEDICTNGARKRGRIKQKKLPLSICNFKDQVKPKESDVKKSQYDLARADKSTMLHVCSTEFAGHVKPVEVAPAWKCQDFHVPRCIKQDKVVKS